MIRKMRGELEGMAEDLGFSIQIDPDEGLSGHRKGKPLLVGELKAMPDGSVVWVTYREHGERSYRMRGPYRIQKLDEGWYLEDGSFGAGEFYPSYEGDDDECLDEGSGEGEMFLYHARKKR